MRNALGDLIVSEVVAAFELRFAELYGSLEAGFFFEVTSQDFLREGVCAAALGPGDLGEVRELRGTSIGKVLGLGRWEARSCGIVVAHQLGSQRAARILGHDGWDVFLSAGWCSCFQSPALV